MFEFYMPKNVYIPLYLESVPKLKFAIKTERITSLSKVAGCRRKSPPILGWLVSAGYSAWHFLNKISLDWALTLTTQPSTSKLSDNPELSRVL